MCLSIIVGRTLNNISLEQSERMMLKCYINFFYQNYHRLYLMIYNLKDTIFQHFLAEYLKNIPPKIKSDTTYIVNINSRTLNRSSAQT